MAISVYVFDHAIYNAIHVCMGELWSVVDKCVKPVIKTLRLIIELKFSGTPTYTTAKFHGSHDLVTKRQRVITA